MVQRGNSTELDLKQQSLKFKVDKSGLELSIIVLIMDRSN
jgi:hypothetical protein